MTDIREDFDVFEWMRKFLPERDRDIDAESLADRVVAIRYTNYRGETSTRRIIPLRVRFAASEWHPTPQWLMDAFDIGKDAERSFALKDIHDWQPDGEAAREHPL